MRDYPNQDTSKARRWTFGECKAEESYIASINPVYPGKWFNFKPETFANYCEMQARHIRFSGYELCAGGIDQAAFIARHPEDYK